MKIALAFVIVVAASSANSADRLGVMLFGASWCPYCHGAASVLASLADAGQIDLIVVSLDGRPVGPVTSPIADDGRARELGVVGVPTTLIFNPTTGEPEIAFTGFKGAASYIGQLKQAAAQLAETR